MQNKPGTLQWVIVSAALMAVVLIMLFNFSKKSSVEAADSVKQELMLVAEGYADDLFARLEIIEKTSQPVATLLGEVGPNNADNMEQIQRLLAVLVEKTDTYKGFYCDAAGCGYDNEGNPVDISGEDYFTAIAGSNSDSYVYTKGLSDRERDTIVVVTRIQKGDATEYVLLLYSMDKLENIFSRPSGDSTAYAAIVDYQGNILRAYGGGDNPVLGGENLVETLTPGNNQAARVVKSRLDKGIKGISKVTVKSETDTLVYVPLSMNRWELVIGISSAYVERRISAQWESTKDMLVQLMAVIFAFVCIVMVLNIINKIRNNERKKQLEDKADTDLLTGLNNKLATERKIKTYMAQNPDSQSMMFLLDIDNFKKINDTMGHAFGDEVLRSLGQQIGSNFRASDIIGRIGGDEFMIFLKGINDAETIRKEARKIENFFKGFQAGEYVKYAATASIGVAIFPQEGADFESLYKAADQGLYKAKKRGKNQLAFYRDEWAEDKKES